MSFMKPEYTHGIGVFIQTDFETHIVPNCTHENAAAHDLGINPKDVVESEILFGVFYRLSASGYMDSTDWGHANTLEDAKRDLEALYGVDAETGETY